MESVRSVEIVIAYPLVELFDQIDWLARGSEKQVPVFILADKVSASQSSWLNHIIRRRAITIYNGAPYTIHYRLLASWAKTALGVV